MAGKTLDFWQVIYKEEQRGQCYPFAKIHKNDGITDYFENDIIAKLVPTSQADYIGVASWRLRQKRNESSTPLVLGHKLELSEEKILSHDFDVAVLTPRRPGFRPLYMAHHWHGRAWADAFNVFVSGYLQPMGIRIPHYTEMEEDLKNTIHENHFIARRDIYHDYVKSCLSPAIDFMSANPIYKTDSGYVHKKRDRTEIIDYQQKSQRIDWPIAPFILERLFSIWINEKNLKVINL